MDEQIDRIQKQCPPLRPPEDSVQQVTLWLFRHFLRVSLFNNVGTARMIQHNTRNKNQPDLKLCEDPSKTASEPLIDCRPTLNLDDEYYMASH